MRYLMMATLVLGLAACGDDEIKENESKVETARVIDLTTCDDPPDAKTKEACAFSSSLVDKYTSAINVASPKGIPDPRGEILEHQLAAQNVMIQDTYPRKKQSILEVDCNAVIGKPGAKERCLEKQKAALNE